MKGVYILLACILLLPKLVWAQYYIELNKENTFHYGNTYLIDVPQINEGNLVIQDLNNLVPINLYPLILGELDTLFVVKKASHWKTNRLATNILKRVVIIDFPQNYYHQDYYSFKRIDTLKDINRQFSLYTRLNKSIPFAKKDSALIYYTEGYGSGCCPRDPKRDRLPLSDFIKLFEKRYSVKVGEVYSFSTGEEGENESYFTLSGLSPEQKVKFIDERQLSLLSDTEKKQKTQANLYTPFWTGLIYWNSKNNVLSQEIIRDIPYSVVDTQPQFPRGIDAFLARFKSIKVDYETWSTITFVVRRDGSLSDVKVLRSNNEKPIKEIKKVIKESPKWIPGKLRDNLVSVQCTYKIHLNE